MTQTQESLISEIIGRSDLTVSAMHVPSALPAIYAALGHIAIDTPLPEGIDPEAFRLAVRELKTILEFTAGKCPALKGGNDKTNKPVSQTGLYSTGSKS